MNEGRSEEKRRGGKRRGEKRVIENRIEEERRGEESAHSGISLEETFETSQLPPPAERAIFFSLSSLFFFTKM